MSILEYELFEIINVRQIVVIVHLLGLTLGAGAAFFSDFLFSHILNDRKINDTEFRILGLASMVVWIGLTVLLLSGIAIFLGDTDKYLHSAKFLAKMTVIFLLFINGVIFHFAHIPALKQFINKDLGKENVFKDKYATPFFIGGAISGVSWVAALVLGSLSTVNLSYIQIMGIYVAVLFLIAIPSALGLKKKFLG